MLPNLKRNLPSESINEIAAGRACDLYLLIDNTRHVMYNRGIRGDDIMEEIWVYEMTYDKKSVPLPEIVCIPVIEAQFAEYKAIYNECFYPMRHSLGIRPYMWFSEESVIESSEDIFVYLRDGEIIGSVACKGNEIDDLIVRTDEMNKGYGRKLLFWAMDHIRKQNDSPICLHVAEWNKNAVHLYEKAGFVISKREQVR